MQPLVSVIIAIYNGEKYLAETIESVFAQSYSPIELIIINDGSTDSTEGIVKNIFSQPNQLYNTQFINQSNQGQAAALNHGIQLAKGAFIAFLDADDIYRSDKISLQVDTLQNNTQIDMVFGHVEQFISPELPIAIQQKRYCPERSMPGYVPSAGLFRKQCFDRAGLFNVQWKFGAFIDWFMRAKEIGLQDSLHENNVVLRRIHDQNLGVTARDNYKDYLRILKNALERKCENENQK